MRADIQHNFETEMTMDYKMEFAHEHHHDYIGDGVYVSFDGWSIWLRTMKDPLAPPTQWNAIALEPAVLDALERYRREKAIRVS